MAKMDKDGTMHTAARVEMHLNGGFSTLILELGGSPLEVRTDEIPFHLRAIGTRVLVSLSSSGPKTEGREDTSHGGRSYRITELPPDFK